MSYYIENLNSRLGPEGGHADNLKLDQGGQLTYRNYMTEHGLGHALVAIFEEIKIAHNFLLDIGAYSRHSSNVMPVFLRYNMKYSDVLLIDGQNKHDDPHVVTKFLTVENIENVLYNNKCSKNIDLLSLDIDNMDYHILEKILKLDYSPRVISLEFNPIFSSKEFLVKKYNKEARKLDKKTQGGSCYGASLGAFARLLESRDFVLIHTVSNNAIFVRSEYDPLNMFCNLSLEENLERQHPNPWVANRKQERNEAIYGTRDLKSIKKQMLKDFVKV